MKLPKSFRMEKDLEEKTKQLIESAENKEKSVEDIPIGEVVYELAVTYGGVLCEDSTKGIIAHRYERDVFRVYVETFMEVREDGKTISSMTVRKEMEDGLYHVAYHCEEDEDLKIYNSVEWEYRLYDFYEQETKVL